MAPDIDRSYRATEISPKARTLLAQARLDVAAMMPGYSAADQERLALTFASMCVGQSPLRSTHSERKAA